MDESDLLIQLSTRLDKWRKTNSGTYTCECPYCHHNKDTKKKTSAGFFNSYGSIRFRCHHNSCNKSAALSEVLKDHADDLYQDYLASKKDHSKKINVEDQEVLAYRIARKMNW